MIQSCITFAPLILLNFIKFSKQRLRSPAFLHLGTYFYTLIYRSKFIYVYSKANACFPLSKFAHCCEGIRWWIEKFDLFVLPVFKEGDQWGAMLSFRAVLPCVLMVMSSIAELLSKSNVKAGRKCYSWLDLMGSRKWLLLWWIILIVLFFVQFESVFI